ncbi:MAG: hypothetical protein DRQ78_07480 [Epsilonproteobacteria bacterium]|nr:MAG: hypothetical protein DRQ78_07480 [Campylobacterota bacterium]
MVDNPGIFSVNPDSIRKLDINAFKNDRRYSKLSQVNMIMTRRCNFDCDYCPEDKNQSNITDWTVESFHNLIDFLGQVSDNVVVLTFFGGEPLLKWRLMTRILDASREKLLEYQDTTPDNTIKFMINISTNGYLLDDDKLKWLAEYSESTGIRVDFLLSVDTWHESTYRHLKGSKDTGLETIRKNMDNLAKNYPQMMGVSCYRVSLVPELLPYIVEDAKQMIDHDPLNVIIHPVTTDDPDEYLWSQEMWDELTDAINEIASYALMTGNVEIENMEGIAKRGGNCGAGSGMLGADSTGNLYSCYFTAHDGDPNDVVANFNTKELYTHGMKYINIEYDDPKCDTCEMEYCHQCHVKNLLHKNKTFCSASWCQEIAQLYSDTHYLCDLTAKKSHYISKENDGQLDMVTFHEKIQCTINSLSGYMKATMSGITDWEPEEHCGCEHAEGTLEEALEIMTNLDMLVFSAKQVMENNKSSVKDNINNTLEDKFFFYDNIATEKRLA